MYKKKLIETSIPLDEINAQAVREKSIRNEEIGRASCRERV